VRLVWDIEYDYDEAYVIGLREGLARWWRRKRPQRKIREFMGTTERVIDMNDAITLLDPDTSQFQTMLMQFAVERIQPKIYWLEDQLFPRLGPEFWGEWDWIE
jgi:hypothetical protein